MHAASIILLAGALICCGPAFGGILYSNLGPPGSVYDSFSFYNVSGASGEDEMYQGVAFAFTPAVSGTDSQVDLGLGYRSGTNSVVVELLTDSIGLPGTVMESWTVNNLNNGGTCCDLVTLNGVFSLSSGTQYWLAVLPGADDTAANLATRHYQHHRAWGRQ